MIRAVKDNNTGAVYEWVKTNAQGVETWVNIPQENWKREQDWTHAEIEALFAQDPQVEELLVEEPDTPPSLFSE
jgi:hypothetical protein